jgi:tRNA(Ile)-lysidine synthase
VSLEGIGEGLAGELTAPRAALIAGPAGARRRLGAMILCAAGHERPPRRDSLERLLQRLEETGDFIATLAGARLEARGERVMVCREAGERARSTLGSTLGGALGGTLAERALPPGETVFDGRFLMWAARPGVRVAALSGRAQRLPAAERRRLRAIPAGARGALPAALWRGRSGAETLSCPILAQDGAVAARPLGLGRLRAALGVYTDEMALWRVAEVDPGA